MSKTTHAALRASTAAAIAFGFGALALGSSGPAFADAKEDEKAAIKSCEKSLCTVASKKDAAGGDVKCELKKTWSKDDIKEGLEKKKLTWSLGDARCTVPLMIPAQALVDGLTKPTQSLDLPSHTAKCEVDGAKEGEKAGAINVTLAPKFEFKDGKVTKAKINVTAIEGPSLIKGAVWTAATAEDYFGVFHDQLVGALNKLLTETCPKNFPAQ